MCTFAAGFVTLNAQVLATLEVDFKNTRHQLGVPMQVDLDKITFLHDSLLQLVQVKGATKVPVATQIETAGHRILHWLIEPENITKKVVYELRNQKPVENTGELSMVSKDGALTIKSGDKNLLRYHFETVYPPAGVDTVFKRSGFIHPLWSPRGQELTRVNAPDHYHHWGLWNPWTQVLFESDTIDFWNLSKKQGTVRFVDFVSKTDGPVYAEYKALHEHVVLNRSPQKVALREVQSVRVYQPPSSSNYYIADIDIELNCATESPVRLLEYRYGGLGLRATEEWNRDNSAIITSEGKSRPEADGSRARWCLVQGKTGNDTAGLVMMDYPTNYNYPEPLRVWPEEANKRGDVFLNFSPTKNMDWLLEPGKSYLLKYRFIVFNDTFEKQQAETAWQDFAEPPVVSVILKK